MKTKDERELLERAQKSATGFGELFDACYDRVYAYAYRRVGSRQMAEDIAATVFEDALNGIKRVRWQGKPIIAWLYRIAARRVADHNRSTRTTETLDDLAETLGDGRSTGDALEQDEEYAAVRRGIGQLNERDREIVRLAFFDELDGTEIAAMLDCSANNAYVRLHRALKNLKTAPEKERRGIA